MVSALGLQQTAQVDFSAGEVQSVAPHRIPPNGAYKLRNLLLDDDGSLYKRGGCSYKSNVATGDQGLTWIWDGYLAGGQRTVYATSTGFYALAADDSTPVALGGAGLPGPTQAVEVDGMLFIGGGYVYGGSLKSLGYAIGTVDVTNGSTSVAGNSTSWIGKVDAGMLLRVSNTGPFYTVASVQTNGGLTLTRPYQGSTATGAGYAIRAIGTLTGTAYKVADIYATVADRLVACIGNQAFFSVRHNPGTFLPDDYHQLPEGVQIIGAHAAGQTLMLFTTRGTWAVSNMLFELVDEAGNPQQRLERAGDVVAWSNESVVEWNTGLIVAATDGVWLLDRAGPPQLLSRSETRLYTDYVTNGYRAGLGSVYRNHFFLPILQGQTPVDLMVCRLDRPTKTDQGIVFPWTHVDGEAGGVCALAVRVGVLARQPLLLAASRNPTSRVVNLTGLFAPDESNALDADGSVYQVELIGRDFPTGSLNKNLVRKLRVRYELTGGQFAAGYAVAERRLPVTEWGLFDWGQAEWSDADDNEFFPLEGVAGDDNGADPFVWWVNARSTYLRPRLQMNVPATKLVIRSVELFVRAGGRL